MAPRSARDGRDASAAAHATTYGATPPTALPPKAPPTWGVTTRRQSGGRPSDRASWTRLQCGACVDAYTVSRPSRLGHREDRAPLHGRHRHPRDRQRRTYGELGGCEGVGGRGRIPRERDLVRLARVVDRSGARRTRRRRARRRPPPPPRSRRRPPRRTRPRTALRRRRVRAGRTPPGSSAISWMGTVGRSLAVKTATTPGWIAAGVVSTCTMRARATGDVTNVSTSAPSACRSAVKCAEPSSSSSVTARSVISGDVTVLWPSREWPRRGGRRSPLGPCRSVDRCAS